MNDTDDLFDFDELKRKNRMNQQDIPDLLNDFADSVNVSRTKSRELRDFVAVNLEFLRGEYDSSIVNGASYTSDSSETPIINGANETSAIDISKNKLVNGSNLPTVVTIEDSCLESGEQVAPPEVGNMSNAYSFGTDIGYMTSDFAKTSVNSSDTYEGAHMVADTIRIVQGINAVIDYRDNTDTFLDFATSDYAKEAESCFQEKGESFDAHIYKDAELGYDPDNLKYASNHELAQAYQSGKWQIEKILFNQGLDLAGIKNSDIEKSLKYKEFTFGSLKGKNLDDNTRILLHAYLELNNIQLSAGKESARVTAGRQVFTNRFKSAVKTSDTYRGARLLRSVKRAGARGVFAPAKARLRISNASSITRNRITNISYSFKMKRATIAQKAKLSAELLAKNKEYAANAAKRNAKLSKINNIQEFVSASAIEKVGIIGSGVVSKFKKTDLYKNTFGKRSAKKNQKKLEKQQKNPDKYNKKRARKARKKERSRKLAYLKKKIIIYSVFLMLVSIGLIYMVNVISIYLGENPFSGDKLATTEYNSVRQEAMDNSILSLQNAQNWIINGTSDKYYNGSLYQVTVKYPDGTSVVYRAGSADPAINLDLLFPSGDKSSIKNLRIPWTYNGTDDSGASLSADGYLGQSIYDEIYQLDENDEIIDDAPPTVSPRSVELYSDVINMTIPDGWISAFSTRPQYTYQNWNNARTYSCADSVKAYTLDDFYKAISSMAVEFCDITGYDDTDGQFYKAYFETISDMAIKNSYYTIKVTTVPKAGFMQYKDESSNVYSDDAYLVHCQVYIHLDASINDLMELADHYDPINHIFTTRDVALQGWRDWITATISATGADNTGYEATRVYNGFFNSDSATFEFDDNYQSYRDTSGFAYDYDNMTDEGDTACSYLYEGLSLDEWIDDLGFVFLNAYSIDGNTVSNMAPIYSSEQIEDYLTQIKSYYYQSTGEELSDARIEFMRQCLSDVGKFYYAFGGKATNVSSPPVGLDCSGFVGYELAKAGLISDPVQSTGSLAGNGVGTKISYANKKPGDIIVKYDPANDTDLNWSSHVVIYLGKFDAGDGKGAVEHTVECTTSSVSGSQVYLMSKRLQSKGYNTVKSFMD